MAETEAVLESDFISFRPYEEKDTVPLSKGKNNIEINVGITRIVFQKTPLTNGQATTMVTQPKKIPRVDSWATRTSISSLSEVSAVGMTTGSMGSMQQSHRSIVEEHYGMKISSKPSNDRHWMPDKLCHQCSECDAKFSVFVRRHHCRICGRIFCSSCSNNTVSGNLLRPPLQGKVRVCSACLAIFCDVNTNNSTSDLNPTLPVNMSIRGRSNSFSSDHQGSPELDTLSAISFNPSVMQNRVSWDDCTIPDSEMISSPSRIGSVGIEFDNPTPIRRETRKRSSKDDSVLALAEDEIDVRLQEIWTKFTDKSYGLAPQSRRHRFGIRTFQNVYIAQEIVDWLIANGHAYTREMAIRIGQTFIDTKYLNVVSSTEQIFRDSKDLILEIGEGDALLPLSTSPTIVDAPNWFLNEVGDDLTVQDLPNRASLHEARIDIDTGLVMFHRHSSDLKKVNNKPVKPEFSPPEILCIEEVENENDSQKDDLPESNLESYFVQNYFTKDATLPPKEGSYLIPPPIGNTIDPSTCMISFSVLTPSSVLQALPLTQASHFAHELQSSSVQAEIKQEHILHHQSHLELFLTQQIMSFGISLSWLDTMHPLILEASRKIRTHILPDDLMDIEAYCKVKKIPGGRKSSCSFVHGVVFSKHVSHKKMDLSLRNPRILMLKCAMEFQRKESQLSSFDTLMLQEQEYLKNLVERVKTFRPDIVLVQKSVARFALEMFYHHRMVVVVNVKPSVMARVARSTQGDLLSNLDQLYFNVKLGTCGRFYVRTYTLSDGIRKTLMYFDECEPKLGGVILLQGSDNHELKKVKKVVQFGLQIAHNMRLESAFLTDEFAVPIKALNNSNEQSQGYMTPPSSPDVFMYPFSNAIFDEPVKQPNDVTNVHQDYTNQHLESTPNGYHKINLQYVKEDGENTYPSLPQDTDAYPLEPQREDTYATPFEPRDIPFEPRDTPFEPRDTDAHILVPQSKDVPHDGTNPHTSVPVSTDSHSCDPVIEGDSDECDYCVLPPSLAPTNRTINDQQDDDQQDDDQQDDGQHDDDQQGDGQHDDVVNDTNHCSDIVFRRVLEDHLVSTSPHIRFTVPYLQTEPGINADIKKYLPNIVYWSHWFQPKAMHKVPKGSYLDSIVNSVQRMRATSQVNAEPDGPITHNYKSVSTHPFVKSTFLSAVNSTEVKAALADFRARASHPDEPNCFFFPSARKATDLTVQLQKIFAKSKEFENKANCCHDFRVTSDQTDLEEPDYKLPSCNSPGLSKRTTRWMIPEKELNRPTTPVKKQEQVTFLTPPETVFHESIEKDQSNDLTKVIEGGRRVTPEPIVLSDNSDYPTLDNEWYTIADEQIDCLDPFNHQSISLVFSSTCHDKIKRPYPCVPPCIIPMNYYGRNDIPMGEFLHRYCFREDYICQSCNVDMSSHQRHFVHGLMELRISMQLLGASIPGGDKRIFTWCTCTQCAKQSTPLVPLSEDALLFSFAKFLELKFYGSEYKCYNFQEGRPSCCSHSLHSYVQFFSFQDKVATFELFPVNIFELRVPPQEIHLDSLQVVHHNYFKEISHISKLIESVFYHIRQYIEIYNIDPVQSMAKNCIDRCLGMREALKLKMKRVKDISVYCGLEKGESVPESLKEEYFLLQDSIAELKRSLADSVEWFNKHLYEIDCKLRELLNKKDVSPRDTPLTVTMESPDYSTASPKYSPHLPHKITPNGAGAASPKYSPHLPHKITPNGAGAASPKYSPHLPHKITPNGVMSNDRKILTDEEAIEHFKPMNHRRHLSDSLTNSKKAEMGLMGEDLGGRAGSHGDLSNAAVDKEQSLKSFSSSGGSPMVSSRSHESDREEELVCALRQTMTSEDVIAVVYSEDIIAKIRGKEIEDPTKFYYLRSTPIATSSHDNNTDPKNNTTSKKHPNSTGNSKVDELDPGSGSGIKSKLASEKLVNFLSKPFQKLPPPFETSEHHLLRGKLRFQISVYENEPTSIIAFALCSRDYAHELKLLVDETRRTGLTESVVSLKPTVPSFSDGEAQTSTSASKTSGFIKNVISEIYKKKLSSTSMNLPIEDESVDQSDPFIDESGNISGSTETGIKWNNIPEMSDRFSSSHEKRHVSLEFADDTTKFFCKVYYAEEFRKLRESIHPEGDDIFIRSLARCVRYEAKGGKSKSMFLKTFEDRLIMKQVPLVEITSFIEIAPQYFHHVSEAIKNKRPSVLAKILGAYSIGFRNSKTGRSNRRHVIIMENLLFNHKCSKVFDLKGSMRGRYVTLDPKKDGKGDVLMDENFLEFVYSNPVYVWPHTKAVLMQAIIADTLFLANNSIMDYSLLTGLDEEKGELVVGIIDFVRPFTLDKRLEMIVKKAGRSVLPTVVYPDLYRKRFMDAMDRYFSPIPDKWTGLGADIRVSF